MEAQKKDGDKQPQPGCNVNSTFNFTVGGIAIAAAVLIGYLVYFFVWR
jgi:hypothetical protein